MHHAMSQLEADGFAIVPGPVADANLARLSAAYDDAFTQSASEVKRGSSNTNARLDGFVNRAAIFDAIYVHEPLLEAAVQVIGAPFKLSAFHARTLHAHTTEQKLHRDFAPLPDGFPMLGFIFMVDAFTIANGATRFVKGSHRRKEVSQPDHGNPIAAACGPTGSMILFNGSVWHGFGANTTSTSRRSIQGALIRRDQTSAVDHAREIRPDVVRRLSSVAKQLLCLGLSGES